MSSKEELLKYLISSKEYISSNELAEYFNVSKKTVYRRIQKLNSLLKSYSLKIESKKGLGYILNLNQEEYAKLNYILNNGKFSELNEEFKDEELVIKKLFSSTHYNIISLSDELYFSESKLRSVIKRAENYLKNFNLLISVDRKNNFLQITGKIQDIFKCKLNFIQNKTIGYTLDFIESINNEEIQQINNIVEKILLENSTQILDYEKNYIENFIIIVIDNVRHNLKACITYEKNDIAIRLIREIKTKLGISDFYGNEYFIHELFNNFEILDNGVFLDLKSDVVNFLGNYNSLKINKLIKNERLFNSLILHIEKFIKRSEEEIVIENPILHEIKKNFPMEFNVSYQLCQYIETKYPCLLNENEIGFITFYLATQNLETQNKIIKTTKKRIVIICHYGLSMASLLKEKIINNFEEIEILGIFPYFLRDAAYKTKPDLVVTSVKLNDCNIPIIYVKNIFDEYFIKEMRHRLAPDESVSKERLLSIVNKAMFYDIEASTGKEAIEKICNKLQNESFISSEIKDEIIKREEVSSTEIGHLTAVPHTISENQNKSFISFSKLKNPIKWGSELVRIVVLVVFNKNDQYNLPAFRKLYDVLNEQGNVLQLIEEFNYEGFLNILNK